MRSGIFMDIKPFYRKIFRKLFPIILVVSVFLCGFLPRECLASIFSKKMHHPEITARAAYVVDYSKGKVLFSRNPHMKFYPASTVKLLTALVVLDRLDLKARVVVSRRAANAAPTKAGLTPGASYTVSDLLKVMLASSANDAGIALAEAVAGSEKKFAILMSKKAKALGARDSHFSNPTGLPDKRQVTTAYDLSLITHKAFNQPFIARVMRQKNVKIAGSDGKAIIRPNHNKLLWRLAEPCVLGKTGYTRSAGHCYAGMSNYDDGNVSVVILKSSRPWSDICRILNIQSAEKIRFFRAREPG